MLPLLLLSLLLLLELFQLKLLHLLEILELLLLEVHLEGMFQVTLRCKTLLLKTCQMSLVCGRVQASHTLAEATCSLTLGKQLLQRIGEVQCRTRLQLRLALSVQLLQGFRHDSLLDKT